MLYCNNLIFHLGIFITGFSYIITQENAKTSTKQTTAISQSNYTAVTPKPDNTTKVQEIYSTCATILSSSPNVIPKKKINESAMVLMKQFSISKLIEVLDATVRPEKNGDLVSNSTSRNLTAKSIPNILLKRTEKTEKNAKHNLILNTLKSTTESVTSEQFTIASENTTLHVQIDDFTEKYYLPPDDQTSNEIENFDVTEDLVEKQINDAINSMPKLPELVLSDNKTHFKFHKDSEEKLIDDRITQIARKLAEASLRKQYEERRLGQVAHITSRILLTRNSSIPIKNSEHKNNKTETFKTNSTALYNVVAAKLIPQHASHQNSKPKTSTNT